LTFYVHDEVKTNHLNFGKRYFVSKIVLTLTFLRKKNSSDREKLLKIKAEGQEFAIIFRSLTVRQIRNTVFMPMFLPKNE